MALIALAGFAARRRRRRPKGGYLWSAPQRLSDLITARMNWASLNWGLCLGAGCLEDTGLRAREGGRSIGRASLGVLPPPTAHGRVLPAEGGWSDRQHPPPFPLRLPYWKRSLLDDSGAPLSQVIILAFFFVVFVFIGK